MSMYRKPSDRLFESQQGVPQPNRLGSDSLEFSALTTFNREAVLSKFLPSFDGFGRSQKTRATRASSRDSGAAGSGSAAAAPAAAHPAKLSGAALASANERRVQQATRQHSSADRLEAYRRLAREEQRLNRTARREQSKLNGLWDAASRIVRHRRHLAPHQVGSARERDALRRMRASGASRTEGKRRATSALIADPPLSLLMEGLAEGYTDELQGILQSVPEPFMQLLRGVFAAQDDDADGLLTIEQLRRAVLGLGLADTPDTLERFVKLSKHKPLVDVVSFVYVIAMLSRGIDGGGSGQDLPAAGPAAPAAAGDAGRAVVARANADANGASAPRPAASALPQDCAAEVLEVLETVREWVTTAEGDQKRRTPRPWDQAGEEQPQQPRRTAGAVAAAADSNDNDVIDADMLRHILRVDTGGSQLSSNEVEDFMAYAQDVLRAQDAQRQAVAGRRRAAGAPTARTPGHGGGGFGGGTAAGYSGDGGDGGGGGGGDAGGATTLNLDRLIHHLVDYSGSDSPYLAF